MNNLDPRTKNSIREFLIKFNQTGKTIICVTHDLHYAEGVFGRAIVLSESHSVCADDGWNNIMNNKELLKKNNVI
jgi:cobalt/nickel transport system ATP-binding protein